MSNNITPLSSTKPDEHLLDIYKDVCSNIRITDETSFKLLSTVPIVSGLGSGALTLLEKDDFLKNFADIAVVSLSLLGAVITIGLFRWELRNIQKCSWLISRAAILEDVLFPDNKLNLQFSGIGQKNIDAQDIKEVKITSIFDTPWGKTQAEKLIYSAAIIVWLIPAGIVLYKLCFT